MHKKKFQASSIFTITNASIQLHLTIFNNEIFLVLLTSAAKKKLVFLVDTGSQISILKAEKILDAKINTKKAIKIIGIANNKPIKSLGVTQAFLTCNDSIISHEFHVMHENVFLRTDGILGADFLLKHDAKIDISESIVELKLKQTKSDIEKNDTKCVSSSQIKQSKTQNDCDKIYFEAVDDYVTYESATVNQIRVQKYKNRDKNFYDNISNDYFRYRNFEKIQPEKIDLCQSEFQNFIANTKINKPFEINYTRDSYTPISDPSQRQMYLMNKIDLSGLSENQI